MAFFKQIIGFSIVAALLYSVTAFIYIRKVAYDETYVLYIGNFLFAAVVGVFIVWYYKKHERNVKTVRLILNGHIVAFFGIIVACLLLLLLSVLFTPSLYAAANDGKSVLKGAPGAFSGTNFGLQEILYLDAIFGNAGASLLTSLLLPFSVMKNLYPDEKAAKTTKNENPKKNYPLSKKEDSANVQ
ncbi:MAG TPA: hypothetical protein VL307_11630 [Chitinophagaceae bacterium]|nr:hypothetical protein [Chitinophagaceae bacterium]